MSKVKIIIVLVAGILFGVTLSLFLQSKSADLNHGNEREIAHIPIDGEEPDAESEM